MWDVGDVECLGCGMLRISDVWDFECSECGMLGIWDVEKLVDNKTKAEWLWELVFLKVRIVEIFNIKWKVQSFDLWTSIFLQIFINTEEISECHFQTNNFYST